MTSISKYLYIRKLDDIVSKYSKRYHSTIKIKPIDVTSRTYNEFDKNNNKDDNFFAKGYLSNCSEKVFVITKVKNTVWSTYIFINVNGEEIFGTI